ncbi:MAG: DUF4079 domain-containing protein [Leptolyngbyaceae cyanobacterium bins.59]|nr:DUF4079 domain-containing protein [Leptolyngbyaceae cyanobacterium bins.59]
MDFRDVLRLVHPFLAVAFVFPVIGIVVNLAWQTRQRRFQVAEEGKSQIPATSGKEHVRLGRWLTGSVVGISLIGLARPIGNHIITKQTYLQSPGQVSFILAMFIATIASLVCLYRARAAHWRGIFATLSGAGLIILGCQDGVYRRTPEWYWSHYYIGIVAALLMIISLAIVPDIYKDRSNRWRIAHTVLNCVALLLFVGQGFTGAKDLLEIPLGWQEPYIYSCNFSAKTCPTPAPQPPQG